MQTIWSRIAQARGLGSACRCPQCLSSGSGVARRAGATATRPAPKYLTSSTLWYSGIFAAAATFDAGLKQQRTERWDKAIAEVRQELGQGKDASRGNGRLKEERAVQETASLGMQNEDSALWDPNADVFSEVEPTFKRPQWPTNTGTRLEVHNLAPESIYASNERRARYEVRGWSAKKVETISLSVDMLQLRIFLALQARGFTGEAVRSVPNDYGSKMLNVQDIKGALNTLNDDLRRVWKSPDTLEGYERTSSGFVLSSFGRDQSTTRSYRLPRDLNMSLQTLFKEHQRHEISTPSLLARVCYSLAVSPSPPNLDTFNTLLLGLSAANETNVVYYLIRSLRQCHLRPNEVTNVAILDHYASANDAKGFVHWVETMRGKHRGLALARPDIRITASCNGRLVPKEGDPGKVIQLPYPTPKVFASLIAGVLKFGGFNTALNVCKNMSQEGWGLCMSGLGRLLYHCAEQRDWHSGLGVWQQIKLLEAKALRQGGVEREKEKIPLPVFASMLTLCLGEGERSTYDDVWQHARKSHRHNVQGLPRLVRAQASIIEEPAVTSDDSPKNGADARDPFNSPEQGLELAEDVAKLAQSDTPALNQVDTATSIPPDLQAPVENPLPVNSKIQRDSRQSTEIPPRHTAIAFPNAHIRRSEPQRQESTMKHLHGSLASYHELEEYEIGKRPMTIHS